MYIAEAHASDEWPISNLPEAIEYLPQPHSIEARRSAASCLLTCHKDKIHPNLLIKLDDMNNSFNEIYASWPFQVWIIDDEKIAFKGRPTVDGFNLNYGEVREHLESKPLC